MMRAKDKTIGRKTIQNKVHPVRSNQDMGCPRFRRRLVWNSVIRSAGTAVTRSRMPRPGAMASKTTAKAATLVATRHPKGGGSGMESVHRFGSGVMRGQISRSQSQHSRASLSLTAPQWLQAL